MCLQEGQTDDGQRRIPILLAGADCTGNEATLAECPGSGLDGSVQQCGLSDIVTLICFSNLDPGEPAVMSCMDIMCV